MKLDDLMSFGCVSPLLLLLVFTIDHNMGAMLMTFDPNTMTFAQGVERLKREASAAGVPANAIVTSRDGSVKKAIPNLMSKNVPSGFTKWQLPVYQDGPTLFFVSFASPNADVPEHAHTEGDGFRFMLSGSILYNGVELTAGDWMFVPKDAKYAFKVGPSGAGMFYCHECCCG